MTAPKPGSWLAKADSDPTLDDTLIEPTGAGAVAAAIPASPEWEQVDADSAANAYAVLARIDNTLGVLSEREAIEATTDAGTVEDADNAWNLADAQAAVEYAMDTVAVYAASEALEAEPMEKAALIVKSVAGLTDALTTVESYGSLRKAGRTLSASNETKLRSASEQITSVLASLPAAPDEVTKEAAPVAETNPASEVVEKSEADLIVKADDTADTSQQMLVYGPKGAAGGVLGSVDPADMTTFANSPAADDTTVDPDVEPAPADPDAPAAPAAVGEPTDPVTKSSTVEDIVKSAVDEVRAEQAELIKGLQADIDFLKAPAAPRAIANGGSGLPVVTRDGDLLKGANEVDELIKGSVEASDSATRTKFDNQRSALARTLLAASRPTA
jgi:hypothetical protein